MGVVKTPEAGGGGIIYAVHFPPIVMRRGDTAESLAIKGTRRAEETQELEDGKPLST